MGKHITTSMINHIREFKETGVHLGSNSSGSNELLYAMDLAQKMYHCEIKLYNHNSPTVFVINEKKDAAMVDNEANLALAIATACALSYGWVDPNV
jgi:hypothetical protein